jgi:DNA-binding Xre family transcriptional regulator
MYESDKRILRLIELLIFEKKIKLSKDFCKEIGVLEQTLSKIKKGTNHFTVVQIEKICKVYNVNSNWIFGLQKNVFRTAGSIEITEF